jgi:hypothetical protein
MIKYKKLRNLIQEETIKRYNYLLALQALNINKTLTDTNYMSWEEFKKWCNDSSDRSYNGNKRRIKRLSKI